MRSKPKKADVALSRQAKTSIPLQMVQRLLGLPRLVRIALCAFFALCVTLSLSPLVDAFYLQFLYTPQTVIAPALVSAGFGLAMYALGWWLVIGTVGEHPGARFLTLWYLLIGIAAVMVVSILLISGITLLNIATS